MHWRISRFIIASHPRGEELVMKLILMQIAWNGICQTVICFNYIWTCPLLIHFWENTILWCVFCLDYGSSHSVSDLKKNDVFICYKNRDKTEVDTLLMKSPVRYPYLYGAQMGVVNQRPVSVYQYFDVLKSNNNGHKLSIWHAYENIPIITWSDISSGTV